MATWGGLSTRVATRNRVDTDCNSRRLGSCNVRIGGTVRVYQVPCLAPLTFHRPLPNSPLPVQNLPGLRCYQLGSLPKSYALRPVWSSHSHRRRNPRSPHHSVDRRSKSVSEMAL